jgi:D-glycero-D-manno-heptose 1,7-bisphosphate phosphatase
VRLDAVYYCAHHPEGSVPELSVRCECRKPEPGMLRQSAADLDLDLHASWLVGDILDDIEAGKRAGCRTVLVDLATEAFDGNPLRRPDFVTRSTREALQLITRLEFAGLTAAPGGARVASA